jgi:hypothetical protein
MDPHGMCGIGKPAVSESVGREQIAEFVVVIGLGDAEDWDERNANCNYAQTHKHHREALAPCQTGSGALESNENDRLPGDSGLARREKNQRYCSNDENRLDYRHQIWSEPRV